MPIEFAVLGLLTESLDKIVKVVVGGGQLADFKHIPHLLCFLVVHGLISPKSGYSEYPECRAEHGDIPILRTALVASMVQAKVLNMLFLPGAIQQPDSEGVPKLSHRSPPQVQSPAPHSLRCY